MFAARRLCHTVSLRKARVGVASERYHQDIVWGPKEDVF